MPIKCDSSSAIYAVLVLASILSIALGALAWARTTSSFLPLPTWIPALATLLPILTPLVFAGTRLLFNTASHRLTQPIQILNHIHTILLTAIATIALSYIFPGNILSCHLEQQWQTYFHNKDAHAIRAIQDQYQCCGLRSIHDRAWPFKGNDNGDNACELQFGYRQSCMVPWRGVQEGTSWMVFAAVLGISLVKIGFAQLSSRRASWMSSQFLGSERNRQRISGPGLEEGDDNEESSGEARRTMLPHSRPGHENVWGVD
ncbi:uncharacterized protein APUU_20939S [Aspergillus puulaauensis]|uniref:Tetraspanin Tsp3 n=1 Tax=Aspergillus puulaauensis TaxID=1220207 RepID=A0A7R7XFR7_9EURO|nr:uncharacterized protein APUU_20939S [Aspergillus puulaauensis]BCS20507.1 hypothetical protein APUU_20939S [Aspergillus puulaauensis]